MTPHNDNSPTTPSSRAPKDSSCRRLLEISRIYLLLPEAGQQKMLALAQALAENPAAPRLDG